MPFLIKAQPRHCVIKTCLTNLKLKEKTYVSFAITTVNKKDGHYRTKKTSLTVVGLDNDDAIKLHYVFSVESLPIKSNRALTKTELNTWSHLKGLHLPKLSTPVRLLIGENNPELFWTMEERRREPGQPFAVRTRLGWSLLLALLLRL